MTQPEQIGPRQYLTPVHTLRHTRQDKLWGCQARSLYAITHTPELLDEDELTDLNTLRWQLRAYERGHMVYLVYGDFLAEPAGVPFPHWAQLFDACAAGEQDGLSLLLVIPSENIPGGLHMVAAQLHQLENGPVLYVADSCAPEVQAFTYEQLMHGGSSYFAAVAVYCVAPADLGAYPAVDARRDLEGRVPAEQAEQRPPLPRHLRQPVQP